MIVINYCIIILITLGVNKGQGNSQKIIHKPSFRIVAPKFLCSENGNRILVAPSQITVNMQTRGGQKLIYKVQIYFKLLGKLKGQQHTLSIWKSVRELEKKIKHERDMISIKNQMVINNNELTPGVSYIFQIVGVDENDLESNSQNFSIVYREGKFGTEITQQGTSVTEEVSLLLIGSEVAYGDMPILIEARSIWCNPTNDFTMKWDINGMEMYTSLEKYFETKGKMLRIPSGILRGGETYTISVQIIGKNNIKITQATMKLTILTKGYTANISPEFLMVSTNKEIEIKLYIKDLDNTGDIFKIEWSCKTTDNSECQDFIASETTTQLVSFANRGSYIITANVELNGKKQVLKSNITVDPNIIAYGHLSNIPTRAISTNEPFELDAMIFELIPNCYAEWIVADEEGFSYFNETIIPGGLGNITVRDVEEAFLSELVDYGNDTILRDIPFKIPKPNEFPDLDGLEPNSNYKFRLKIICPEPKEEFDTGPRKNITSYMDFTFETNAPPEPLPMDVDPLIGDSLRTIFKFSTGIANDTTTDYPLKYIFYYIVDDFVLNLGEFYETMETSTDLPYSDSEIKTFLQVCDSRDACSTERQGPNITINLIQNISDAEFKFKQNYVQKNMETMNLDSSFTTAIGCILTYQHFDDSKYLTDIITTLINSIKSTTEKIKLKQIFIYSDDEILYFVKLSKKVLDYIKNEDKDVYKGLLDLLDGIEVFDDDKAKKSSKMIQLNDLKSRFKRESSFSKEKITKRDRTRDKILTSLGLYEKIVEDEDFENIVLRVERNIKEYCVDSVARYSFILDKTFVAFEILKTDDPKLFQNVNLTIPFPSFKRSKTKFIFSKKPQFPLNGNYCFAKIVYPNTITNEENIYEFILYRLDGTRGGIERIHLKDGSEKTFIYEIPILSQGMYSCGVKTNIKSEWNVDLCETVQRSKNIIKCQCSTFGLIKAIFTNGGLSSMSDGSTTISGLTTVKTSNLITSEEITTSPTITITDSKISATESSLSKQTNKDSEEILPYTNVESTTNSWENTLITEPPLEATTSSTVSSVIHKPTKNNDTTVTPDATTILTDVTTVIKVEQITALSILTTDLPQTTSALPNTFPSIPTEYEIITLSDDKRSEYKITTLSSTESSVNQSLTTEIDKSVYTYITTLSSVATTIQQSLTTEMDKSVQTSLNISSNENFANNTNDNEKLRSAASIGFSTAFGILFFCAAFGIIYGIFYNQRKRKQMDAHEIEIETASYREPSKGIRYGRFQDEANMRGVSSSSYDPII